MGCLYIALKELGIKVNKYFAIEIDKHAIKQTKLNFPDIIHLGDITQVSVKDFEGLDIHLIGAGSPCQGFSFAGKQLAFDDPRSALFFEFIRILREVQTINPDVKYLLENVKMKKEHELVITRMLNIAPITINSALVSAQNRVRLYWTNIANEPYGLFGDIQCTIPQPEDRGILLRDILEDEVEEKYYISQTAINRIHRNLYSSPKINPGKTGTLSTKNNSGQLNLDSGTTLISETATGRNLEFVTSGKVPPLRSRNGCAHDNRIVIKKDGQLKPNQNKAACFTAGANSGGNHSDMDLIIVAQRGRNPENPKSRKAGLPTEQQLEPRTDGKTNCLTSVQKDNLVMQLNKSTESGGVQPYQQNRVYDTNGISPALSTDSRPPAVITHRIRRLTPTEAARLQTIPAWYRWNSSDTQIYKMCGNGWTIEVIKHILSHMT